MDCSSGANNGQSDGNLRRAVGLLLQGSSPDRKLSLVWLLVVSFQLVSLHPLDLHWFLRVPLVLLGMLGQRLVWAMIRQW